MVEYAVILDTPEDFYEFTVDAKNDGTLDTMVDVVSNKVYASDGETERELPNYLTYTVTYEDGSRILVDDLLEKNTYKIYKVRVEFKKYINTVISLYSAENIDKDYEIGFEIVDYDSTLNESRTTFATARAEQTSFYPGVVFRRVYEQTKLEVQSRKTC